jgi:NitT/TauT family transport system permease protein
MWRELVAFRGRSSRPADLGLAVAGFALVLAGWWWATASGLVVPQVLPGPWAVVAALWRMIVQQGFLVDCAISIGRVWLAFLLSVVMAVPLGILMSTYRIVGGLTEPLVDFIRYLPVPALVPLTIIWLGIGEGSKVALLWLGTFFQLVLLVADDMRRVPHEYVEVAFTLGAKPRNVLKDVALRAMGPTLVDNLRITLGWCWTYLVLAEIVAADSGLGFVIWSARRYVKTPEVMAGVVVIGIIGLVTDQLLRMLHRRMFKYL